MVCNINIEEGIMNCGGSEEFYVEIIDAFVEEGKKEELIQNYADKDWNMYKINVHGLKGTLRLIGAVDAGNLAEKLQMAAESLDIATIDSLHNILLEMIDTSLAQIRSEL